MRERIKLNTSTKKGYEIQKVGEVRHKGQIVKFMASGKIITIYNPPRWPQAYAM